MSGQSAENRIIRATAVSMLLSTIVGEDVDREGLIDTPERVARMYDEVFGGYGMDPKDILSAEFTEGDTDQMVVVSNIQFYSHCEHHMVPFFGTVAIGYLPKTKVVGLSKLARLVDCYAQRLQVQERLTSQIASAIMEHLNPLGCMVVVKAEHLCMAMRGVRKPGAITTTSVVRGVFREDHAARDEFLSLAGIR